MRALLRLAKEGVPPVRSVGALRVPEMEHARCRSRPAAAKTAPPQANRQILILSVHQTCAASVVPVHPLEVLAIHADQAVRVHGWNELRLPGSPRPPAVASGDEIARATNLARCSEQPPRGGPSP